MSTTPTPGEAMTGKRSMSAGIGSWYQLASSIMGLSEDSAKHGARSERHPLACRLGCVERSPRAAAIVSRLTAASNPPRDAYLVVQREAAERFVGKPRPTLVAALLMPWFEASIVHRFRATDFAPAPRVDVVMLRLHKRGPPFVRD